MNYCRICHAPITDLGCACYDVKCPYCGNYLSQDFAEWFELGHSVVCPECGARFGKGTSLDALVEDE